MFFSSKFIHQEQRQAHTVLVRMDKLGDLILSLPVDHHPALQGQNLIWAITDGLDFVAEQGVPNRKFKTFAKRFNPLRIFAFKRWLQQVNPIHVVILHAPWWVSLATWMANVPVRIGPLSQWHSYLFLNFGVRQKRSISDRHESDYNFDLVEKGFEKTGGRSNPQVELLKKQYLKVIPPNPTGFLQSLKLKSKKYVVIHPGMGGSAFNWPAQNYLDLAAHLTKQFEVVITGTAADRKYLEPIEEGLKAIPQVRWTVGDLSSADLMNVLSQAYKVVAPSTGVLHLAASLGTPVVGIYSPRKVEHPRRWGPKGPNVQVISPKTESEDNLRADIMETITVNEVAKAVLTQ